MALSERHPSISFPVMLELTSCSTLTAGMLLRVVSVLLHLTCRGAARYGTERRRQPARPQVRRVGWGLELRWWSRGELGSETGAFCRRALGTRTAR